jgi:small subunit ribosomal protein S18
MAKQNEIKFLTSQRVEKRQKKYCRFKKMGLRYIDYKDGEFLKKFRQLAEISAQSITGDKKGPPDGHFTLRY